MNLQTNLYKHQEAAVAKLLPTRVGALFCDMGTGKTRAAIELVYRRRQRIARVLWFCPVSLKETIAYEICKHTDAGPAELCIFDDRTSQRTVPQNALWYVVGIESMSASSRVVLAANSLIDEATCVIVDESSYIKGHASLRTQRITAISERARYRLLLTGTPLSQGVVDLYAQMRFLSPAILGYSSFYSFAANHLEYSDKYPGKIVRAHNVPHLAAKIQPYVYQVTKAECLDLPPKLYDVAYYHLTPEQRGAYQQAKDELLPLEGDVSDYALFRLFTALQEIISGFWNRRPPQSQREQPAHPMCLHEFAHRRLDLLVDRLAAMPTDARVIIWCRFQYSVQAIHARLAADYGAGAVTQHHGGQTTAARSAELARWRTEGRFLIATQATGGHGLTLNEAHYAVFYENGFKYAERAQAEDRFHRVGQDQPCTYVDLVALASIDDRIQRALASKADVVESFRRQVEQVKSQKNAAQALAALRLEL